MKDRDSARHFNDRTLDRMRLALLDEELEISVNALLRAGIPVVILKGMDLGRRFYPNRLDRPMTDVDLLVPPDSMDCAIESLARAGFKKAGPHPRGRIRVELMRDLEGPAVELHRRLLAGDSDAWLRGVWSRAERVGIPGLGGPVRVLSPEDQIVYLIRHAGGQHLLESPIWLRDIQLVLEASPALNWESVVRELRRFRTCAAAYLILSLLMNESGLAIPENALKGLAGRITHSRRLAIEEMASKKAWFDSAKTTYREVIRRRFLLKDSWREGIAYALWAAREHRREILISARSGTVSVRRN